MYAINHVATISSNNDKELGNVIAGAFKQVGKNGVVTMEVSNDNDNEVVYNAILDVESARRSTLSPVIL